MTMRTMIHCERLTKHYGSHVAVQDVTFSVHAGEIVGFLGPNAAGKTTTMRILTCYISPTRGHAEVAGLNVTEQSLAVRRRIGYLPEDTPIYRDMTVLEYLEYITELRGIAPRERRPRIKKIGEATGITNVWGRPIAELSKGYRQRVGLAQAIVHEPEILILDEPTSGLDPNQIVEIRQLIKELGREKTIILSTHILPEVQATCDRVVIISQGHIVADGRPDDLVASQRSNKYRILLETISGALTKDTVQATIQRIPGVKDSTAEPSEGGTLQMVITSQGTVDLRRELFQCAVNNHWPLLELHRQEGSLEEVFAHLTRGDANTEPQTNHRQAA